MITMTMMVMLSGATIANPLLTDMVVIGRGTTGGTRAIAAHAPLETVLPTGIAWTGVRSIPTATVDARPSTTEVTRQDLLPVATDFAIRSPVFSLPGAPRLSWMHRAALAAADSLGATIVVAEEQDAGVDVGADRSGETRAGTADGNAMTTGRGRTEAARENETSAISSETIHETENGHHATLSETETFPHEGEGHLLLPGRRGAGPHQASEISETREMAPWELMPTVQEGDLAMVHFLLVRPILILPLVSHRSVRANLEAEGASEVVEAGVWEEAGVIGINNMRVAWAEAEDFTMTGDPIVTRTREAVPRREADGQGIKMTGIAGNPDIQNLPENPLEMTGTSEQNGNAILYDPPRPIESRTSLLRQRMSRRLLLLRRLLLSRVARPISHR